MKKDSLILLIAMLCISVLALGAIIVSFGQSTYLQGSYIPNLAGISKSSMSAPETTNVASAATSSPNDTYKKPMIGMVATAGGFGDLTFNDTIWKGVYESKGAYVHKSQSLSEYIPAITEMVNSGKEIIVLPGFDFGDIAYQSAQMYPKVNFILIDSNDAGGNPGAPNLRGITFRTDQASFLIGYAAAWTCAYTSGCSKVATYGGVAFSSVTDFMQGYYDGVQWFNANKPADVTKTISVLGWHPTDSTQQKFVCTMDDFFAGLCNAFGDLEAGAQITTDFLNAGASIVFPVAGGTSFGSLWVGSETNDWYDSRLMYVIGVDSDWTPLAGQFEIDPAKILTSAQKNMDIAVEQQVNLIAQGKGLFLNKSDLVGGLGEGLVGYSPLSPTTPHRTDLIAALEGLIQGIIANGGVYPTP